MGLRNSGNQTIKCNETKSWRIKNMDNGTAIINIPNDNTSVWKSEMELPLGTMIEIMGFEPVLLNGDETSNKTIYMLSHEDCWVTKNTGPAPGNVISLDTFLTGDDFPQIPDNETNASQGTF